MKLVTDVVETPPSVHSVSCTNLKIDVVASVMRAEFFVNAKYGVLGLMTLTHLGSDPAVSAAMAALMDTIETAAVKHLTANLEGNKRLAPEADPEQLEMPGIGRRHTR